MQWVSFESAYAVAVYLLLSLVALTFFRYTFFSSKADHPGAQKLMGGLTVFAVALLSENDLVVFASLFIGGLIIASEEFMQNLAIILRSRSEDIRRNLNTTKASREEIAEKRRAEAEHLRQSTAGQKQSAQKLRKSAAAAEKQVADYFSKKFGELFESQVKASLPVAGPSLVVDGVIKTPDNRTYAIIEVQYALGLKESPEIIAQALKRVRTVFPDQRIIICLVSEPETFADTETSLTLFDAFKELQDGNAGLILFTTTDSHATPLFGDPFFGD